MPTLPEIPKVSAALGLPTSVRTPADLDQAVRAGLPYRSLVRLAKRFGEGNAARVYRLVAPRQTLKRREAAGRLKPDESERLERLARLLALAEQVWESEERARGFMTAPHPRLDHRSPLELAATELGARRVEELLWNLEYSLPV
ncbi:MAG TPA: antitoxin Xre/MbcA/ParS toxin-binding domain-containing protein [Gemmatimonadales bacterium]|nr:antitoxin Xre/MbcA/ParS toxin-binding domain-containing protein [Gemmatimonadales bacterium]